MTIWEGYDLPGPAACYLVLKCRTGVLAFMHLTSMTDIPSATRSGIILHESGGIPSYQRPLTKTWTGNLRPLC